METDDGVAALTHLRVWQDSPGRGLDIDPAAVDEQQARVLEVAGIIVPGHVQRFRVR